MPARRYLWYYMGHSPTGQLVATFHPGEGIVVTGQTEPWRVMRHHGIRTLLMPTPLGGTPLASLFHASAGLFATTCRVTLGEGRVGGWELIGRGWRGGVLRRESNFATAVTLSGEGDPPNLYIMEPSSHEGIPLPVALLVAYVLIEQEIREGAWVKRPTAPAAETLSPQ